MTDDLEPRLSDHLRQRATRVHASPDLADVHHRIDARGRRTTRVLGAALALALVVGPVTGWALARSTEPDVDAVTASGPTGSDDLGSGATDGGGGWYGGYYADYIGSSLELLGERTTAEGIRLVTRVGKPYDGHQDVGGHPCLPDSLVRVGVTDGDLVGVATMESRPGGSGFAVTGAAEGHPIWVVAVRNEAVREVTAHFPNGTSDTAPTGSNGLAVLAAYANDGRAAEELLHDEVRVEEFDDERMVRAAELGDPACDGVPVPAPMVMPEPGEPPADEASARADIEALFSGLGGQDPELEMQEHERPNVWRDADTRFRQEHPEYLEWAKETYSTPLEIVFTAPDRATVRYELQSDNPEIPVPGERVGEALLIDGVWKMSIDTSCGNLALAGIECDFSIEG